MQTLTATKIIEGSTYNQESHSVWDEPVANGTYTTCIEALKDTAYNMGDSDFTDAVESAIVISESECELTWEDQAFLYHLCTH